MNKSIFCKFSLFYTFILLFSAQDAFAANFNITPLGELPTTVISGQSVSARYIVTNMTSTQRNGYTMQGLPATVTQNTTSPNCTNPINLGPKASCQLQLDITGAVSSTFALCKASSCTTSITPLNVSTSAFTMPSNIYVINSYNFPAVSVCALDQVNGQIVSCQDAGGAGVFNGIPLGGIVVNNTGTVAYISNATGTGTDPFTYQCQINALTHTFSSCSSTTVITPTGYTPYEGLLGINSTNTLIYLTDTTGGSTGRILACPIIASVIDGSCVDTGATPISSNVVSVILNKAGTTAYIGNYNAPAGVNVCAANGSTFSNCINKTGGSINNVPFTFQSVGGVALNKTEDTLYIADGAMNVIYGCSTTSSNSTTFSNCFIANPVQSNYNLVLNATNTVAYITDYSSSLYSCPILEDGTFPTCTSFTVPGDTVGMALVY